MLLVGISKRIASLNTKVTNLLVSAVNEEEEEEDEDEIAGIDIIL